MPEIQEGCGDSRRVCDCANRAALWPARRDVGSPSTERPKNALFLKCALLPGFCGIQNSFRPTFRTYRAISAHFFCRGFLVNSYFRKSRLFESQNYLKLEVNTIYRKLSRKLSGSLSHIGSHFFKFRKHIENNRTNQSVTYTRNQFIE